MVFRALYYLAPRSHTESFLGADWKSEIHSVLTTYKAVTQKCIVGRARKLYTSARIYEWKFGKGERKLPFASPTGRVDFYGFVIIFEEKKRTN